MRIAIIGAGAIGSLLAVKLHSAGYPVTLVSRGEAGLALRRTGLRILTDGVELHVHLPIALDINELTEHDVVFIAVKGNSLTSIAEQLSRLVGKKTVVVTAINGIPWWLSHTFSGDYQGYIPSSIASQSILAEIVPVDRTVGCVVFPCCNRVGPGVFHHLFEDKLILGCPHSSQSYFLETLVDGLNRSGFSASTSEHIGNDVWSKLISNLAHNPLSALTGATCDLMLSDDYLKGFCTSLMNEANDIGVRLGYRRHLDLASRNDIIASKGTFKTSMLQDAERGREMELDTLVFAVKELAVKVEVDTPFLDVLIGLLRVSILNIAKKPAFQAQHANEPYVNYKIGELC